MALVPKYSGAAQRSFAEVAVIFEAVGFPGEEGGPAKCEGEASL